MSFFNTSPPCGRLSVRLVGLMVGSFEENINTFYLMVGSLALNL